MRDTGLAAALSIAGTGSLLGSSVWLGAAMLLAYGLGHSVLPLAAGVVPSAVQLALGRVATQWSGTAIRYALAGLVVASVDRRIRSIKLKSASVISSRRDA